MDTGEILLPVQLVDVGENGSVAEKTKQVLQLVGARCLSVPDSA